MEFVCFFWETERRSEKQKITYSKCKSDVISKKDGSFVPRASRLVIPKSLDVKAPEIGGSQRHKGKTSLIIKTEKRSDVRKQKRRKLMTMKCARECFCGVWRQYNVNFVDDLQGNRQLSQATHCLLRSCHPT